MSDGSLFDRDDDAPDAWQRGDPRGLAVIGREEPDDDDRGCARCPRAEAAVTTVAGMRTRLCKACRRRVERSTYR